MKITIEKNTDLNYPNCKVINIYGDNYSGVTHHCRTGSRAIVQENGKLLISHEKNIGQWMTPGGGTEGDETPVECCIREVAEETGYIVEAKECFLIFNEYYEDWKYISYYFECVITGTTERKLTSREIKVGACPEWVDFDYIKDVFSHHQDYAESNEERRGIYLREFSALDEFLKYKNGKLKAGLERD